MGLYFNLTGSCDVRKPDDLYNDTHSALKLLIGGSKGIRLFELNKGCSIDHLNFENNVSEDVINNRIKEQVAQFLPYVKILSIKLNKDNRDTSLNNVSVNWTIPKVNQWVQTTVINTLK